MAANRIVVSEFGTVAHPDPCKTWFQRYICTHQDFINFRTFVKGGGGGGGCKRDNCRGAKTIVVFLPSMKNDVVLINLIILGAVCGYAPPGNISTPETVHWFPSILIVVKEVGCVSYCA